MKRRAFVATIAAVGGTLATRISAFGQDGSATPTPTTTDGGTDVTTTQPTAPTTGYAPVNGLDMYYEIHGAGEPLVLIHGAYGTASMWGAFVPALAETRRVIVPEMQAHGRTADIDRPLRYETMADDVAGLLDHLGIARADVFGYSLGGAVALRLAMRDQDRVRKLVAASASHTSDAVYPELLATIETITPEVFAEAPFYKEYLEIAPDPDGFPNLVEKLKDLDVQPFAWPDDEVRAVAAPTLLVYGDIDIVFPESMVALFRLRGGGVAGDLVGLPPAQLAILPGTTHVGVIERADWLVPMVEAFLAAPMPDAE